MIEIKIEIATLKGNLFQIVAHKKQKNIYA